MFLTSVCAIFLDLSGSAAMLHRIYVQNKSPADARQYKGLYNLSQNIWSTALKSSRVLLTFELID